MELQNCLNTTEKVIAGRFDFKGSQARAEWKEKENLIEIRAEDEMKVKAVRDILLTNMGKRGIGIDKDKAKIINRLLKESGSKVKAQYMDQKFRLESKSIDELQAAYLMLKKSDELNIDLQMENMKR
jgi:uncharacterized protein YajQ (UPF0234 family)